MDCSDDSVKNQKEHKDHDLPYLLINDERTI